MHNYPNVRIVRFGSYFPKRVVSNQDIVHEMGSTSNPHIIGRVVGSNERYLASQLEMGSDMMAEAGRRILSGTDVSPSSIDRLICSCDVPDQAAPDTSVLTQAKLGLRCPSFGISMSCSAWICGVQLGCGFIEQGDKRVLILAASTVGSKFRFKTPMHRSIFGDGAGGVLLERSENAREILSIKTWTDGQYAHHIYAGYGWSQTPNGIPHEYHGYFYMSPDNKVFFDAIDQHIKPFYASQLKESNLKPQDISLYVVHQASMPIFNYTLESLNIPRDRTVCLYAESANTISAELPITVDRALKDGRMREGDVVYLLTYGAGFTAAGMLFKVGKQLVNK